jgi:hypothetical protein
MTITHLDGSVTYWVTLPLAETPEITVKISTSHLADMLLKALPEAALQSLIETLCDGTTS